MFVKNPKFSRTVGITPIMEAEQMRVLLDSIPVTRKVKLPKKHSGGFNEVADIKSLRDRAAIAIMAYTFASCCTARQKSFLTPTSRPLASTRPKRRCSRRLVPVEIEANIRQTWGLPDSDSEAAS